ncbi:MAG: Transcriptional regulator, LysR family [uncultured Gemmatimonadaceae bacterium]|uniref:Transcriptional regulator, LysR family n=1 Tax=uncultured Gemmatimonadaceae bacterium TaxID=246130 RepID=A0A6J4MA27_9BACT|nr:MAG: Transcriptional regulator, LysR family [uncultured Gemmatimonadaceae bacterium]
MTGDDLDGMAVFAAVAEAGGFRAAAERLGVSGAAVSQTMRRLEDRLGVALMDRTTRSARLTDAGARLYAALRPALDDVRATVDALGDLRARPAGTLRLCVSSIAESFLRGPALAGFVTAHTGVRLDVVVTDDDADIVAGGFDAGVRLGEVIDQDMIAVPVSGEQRQPVVASPAYLARRGAPRHPRELPAHDCVGWRRGPGVAREFSVDVAPRVTTNDMALMVHFACAGVGLTTGMEETFRAHVARGDLVPVLEAYCAPFTGFYLYYPKRRHPPPRLRALVDYLRARRRGGRAGA